MNIYSYMVVTIFVFTLLPEFVGRLKSGNKSVREFNFKDVLSHYIFCNRQILSDRLTMPVVGRDRL